MKTIAVIDAGEAPLAFYRTFFERLRAETTAERKAFMTRFVMFSVNTAARFSPWDGERRAQTSSACFLE